MPGAVRSLNFAAIWLIATARLSAPGAGQSHLREFYPCSASRHPAQAALQVRQVALPEAWVIEAGCLIQIYTVLIPLKVNILCQRGREPARTDCSL